MRTTRTFYDVLGVMPSASEAEIRAAYRKLAKKYHPDVNPGDGDAEAMFVLVAEAWETLSDPDLRLVYDLSLAEAPKRAAPKRRREAEPEPEAEPEWKGILRRAGLRALDRVVDEGMVAAAELLVASKSRRR